MHPRLRLSASETVIDTDPQTDACAAEAFARDHAIAFTDIFTDDVCAMLDRVCAQATFIPETGVSGPRLREAPMRTALIIRGLLNRPAVRDWIGTITGRGPLNDVRGSTARFTAGTGQQLHWHNDVNDDPRALGFTVGLGHVPYEGGLFEIRPTMDSEVTFRFHHARPFSFVVFPISKKIMHRVTPVTAGGPRTVFGGWFWGPQGVTRS
jgi:2-oxoglutarate-Fe(II)-dependent oxygenase superfamily protein